MVRDGPSPPCPPSGRVKAGKAVIGSAKLDEIAQFNNALDSIVAQRPNVEELALNALIDFLERGLKMGSHSVFAVDQCADYLAIHKTCGVEDAVSIPRLRT